MSTYSYVNNTIIQHLQSIDMNIKPYSNNYVDLVKKENIPKVKRSTTAVSKICKPSEIVKIYDVNNALVNIITKSVDWFKENSNIASIDRRLYKQTCKRNMYPSTLGYGNFPKASCISINNVVCHGVPYERYLKDGDIVTLDFCIYNGFHTDWAHTYEVGRVSGDDKRLVKTTLESLNKAIQICKPGAYYKDIGFIVNKVAKENGYVVIDKFGGHGIGKELHMLPFVSNKPIADNKLVMKEGDMFTIEPLLTKTDGKTKIHKDGFSILTNDDKNAAHFERTLMITNAGCKILNDY